MPPDDTPPKPPLARHPPGRPTVANADVPSETAATGLPSAGEGASAAHFARDTVGHQANEGEEPASAVPADPRDRPA